MNILTRQQIIIQSSHLINSPQRTRRHMKGNHFIQSFGIYFLNDHIGIPSTTRLFHGEGDVVPEANVFAVVEAAEGAGGAVACLLGGDSTVEVVAGVVAVGVGGIVVAERG